AIDNATPPIAASCTNVRTRFLLHIRCSRAFSLWRRPMLGPEQGVVQERTHPHSDRAICDVEDIPIVAPPAKVKKIGNPSINQPIDEIAGGPTDHKPETRAQHGAMRAPQPPDEA